MKKLLAVLLLTLSFSANAENWKLLVDIEGGNRLLVDYDSLQFSEYTTDKKTKSWYLKADMFLVNSNTPIVAAIDAKECMLKNSGALVLSHDGETYSKFWSDVGGKVYDVQGQFLCMATKKALQALKKPEPRKIAI